MHRTFHGAARALFFALLLALGVAAWPGPAHCATFYVDDRAGDDGHAGNTPATAWKTVARVNKARLSPGDAVLLRRGGTWRETLMPPASGGPGRPIAFGAFGPEKDGRPRLLGSVDASGPERWTRLRPGVWAFAGVSWKPNHFGLRQGGLWHDGLGARQAARTEDLAEPWDFAVDPKGGRVLVRLDENPGTHAVEIQQRNGVGFTSASHIELSGLEIAYCGMGVGIWGGDGWRILDLDLHDVVEDAVHANGPAGDPPRGGLVRGCAFRDWAWKAVARPVHDYQDWKSNEPYMGYGLHVLRGDDWVVENNDFGVRGVSTGTDSSAVCFDDASHPARITGNRIDLGCALGGPSAGILVWATKSPTQADMLIQGNRLANLRGMGISVHNFRRYAYAGMVEIRDNVVLAACGRTSVDADALRVWTDYPDAGPVTVDGNVLVVGGGGEHFHPAVRVRASRGVFVSNNAMYGADAPLSVERGSEVVAEGNVAGGKARAVRVDASTLSCEGNCWDSADSLDEDAPSGLVLDADQGLLILPPDSACAGTAATGPLATGRADLRRPLEPR